jgi:hypothetical protein
MCDSRRGFGFDVGFIDHLRIVTTNNDNSPTRSHTPNITGTTALSQLRASFRERCPAMGLHTTIFYSLDCGSTHHNGCGEQRVSGKRNVDMIHLSSITVRQEKSAIASLNRTGLVAFETNLPSPESKQDLPQVRGCGKCLRNKGSNIETENGSYMCLNTCISDTRIIHPGVT